MLHVRGPVVTVDAGPLANRELNDLLGLNFPRRPRVSTEAKVRIYLLADNVFRSLREQGIGGTIAKSIRYIRDRRIVDDFDRRYGTDTAATRSIWQLDVSSKNARFGTRYQPTNEGDIEAAWNFIEQSPDRFTFIDLGSGKGRCLIIAARLGFRSVVGVEFARELSEIAQSNLKKVGLKAALALHMDATDYVFPPGPMLVYMYNPFQTQVMSKIIDKLRQRCAQRPGDDIYVVYLRPECRQLLDDAPFLERLGHPVGREDIVIWKAKS
jgi:16S rRNA G966 N2-methylase RsmD